MITQNCAPATRRRHIARVFLTLVMGSWLVVASAGAVVRVAIIGDYGEDSAGVLAVANLVHGMSPDIVVTTGDNNYDDKGIDNNVGKYYARYIGAYTGNYPPGAALNRFFPSLGNHDYLDGGGLPEYLTYFTLPGAGVQSTNTSGNERYYDIVHGPIHFFVINSNAQEPDGRDSTSVQARWLRARLAATTSPWKIVILHHAPFSSGEHGSSTIMQWPYQAWGASIVIAGHDHDYERFVFDGFTYVVNGIGGRSLRNFGAIQPGSVVRYNADFGAMLLTGDATHLTFETIAVSPSDSLVDRFTLERSGALPELWVSPAGIAFGNAYLGDAAVRTLVLQNAGFGDLAVDALTIGGAHATEFEVRRAQGSMPRRLPTYTTASVGSFVLAPGESTLVAVRFEPLSLGPKTAALRVMSNDPSRSTAEFPLTGNATLAPVPAPDIVVSPPALDFGAIPTFTQTTGSVRVHNRGSLQLHVSSASLTGADAPHFAVTQGAGPFTVAPGESTTVSLRFAPTSAGWKSVTLRFQSDDPDAPALDVPVTGDALAPLEPHLAVAPDSVHFGTVVILTNVTRSLEVRNAGLGTLAVSSVTLVGAHAAEFAIGSGGGAFALTAGGSTDIQLRFSPATVGAKSAALRLLSNDPDQPTTDIPLTGVARPPPEPEIGLSTSSLDFGGVLASSGTATHTLVVHNTGELLLSVSGTSLAGAAAGEFRVISGAAPFGVAPGDSAIVQLQFAPTTTGTKGAALRIVSNDPQQGTQDIMLTGIGIASSATRLAVVFQESVDGGSTNSVTVATSRNVAAASGAVYLAAVTSRDPVSVSSVSGMGLAWTRLRAQCGGRQQTMIELWAGVGVPSAGAVTARFASAPNSAAIVVSRYGGAAASPFGTLVSGNSNGLQGACSGGTDTASYSLPLGTTAAGALVFVAAAVRNRDLTPGSGYTLRDEARAGSGGWISGLVTLDRTVATIGNVNVNGTLSNDVDWSVAAVEIVPAIVFPEITVTPAAHDFGALPLGTTADTSFEIRNDGAASLQVPGVSVQGLHAADFAMTSGATVPVLAPGARHTVTVRFAPTAAGVRSAVLRIVSDDPDEITRDLPLTGTGVVAVAAIAVAPSTVGFDSIPALTSTNQSLQVSNQGNVALHVTQVRVTGADSLSFTWTGATVPFSVLPGASTNLVLTFAPVTQGSKSAVLRLTSNDADTATLDVPLAGTALAPLVADIVVASDTLDFAAIAVFTNVVRLLGVRNVGTGNLTVNAPALLGPDAVMFTLANPAAFTLAPGDSTTLTITFTPTSPGPKNAILRLTSNDPDESPLSITLTGVGAVPPEGHVVFEGSASGGATSKTTVTTTASLAAEPGDLVLAVITSKSYVNVTSVSGLGLSWTLVRAQCGARSQTGVQVWKGSGTPIPGVVTATFASAPTSAVIVVARYSGADPVTPLGTTRSANTLGVGGACSGGTDTASFGMSLQTTVNDAMVFAAVAMRSRVLTPGAGYAQREQFYAGPDGSIAGLAVVDQAFDVPGAVNVNGSFDGAVDWAVVGVEVRPYVGAAKQTAASPTAVYEAGLTVGHGIGVANRWVELTAPTPLAARVRLLDVRGRAQQTLFAGVLPAGRTRLPWGTTAVLPAGIYFVHAEIGTQRFVRKAVLLH